MRTWTIETNSLRYRLLTMERCRRTTPSQELNMTEPGNKEQHGEDSQAADEGAEDERMNDPLTRTDVKAPRVAFESQTSPEE
jgi:hypothetical protein